MNEPRLDLVTISMLYQRAKAAAPAQRTGSKSCWPTEKMALFGSSNGLARHDMNSIEWTFPTALGGAMVLAGTALFTTLPLMRSSTQATANLVAFAAPPPVVARPVPLKAFTPVSVFEQPADPTLQVGSAPVATKAPQFRTASVQPAAAMTASRDVAAESPARASTVLDRPAPTPEHAHSRERVSEEPAKTLSKRERTKLASRGPKSHDAQSEPEKWRAMKTSKANALNLGGHIDDRGIVDSLASSHLRDAFKSLSSYSKLPQHVRNLIEAQNINLSKLAPYRQLLGIRDKKLEDEQGVRFERVAKH